MKHSSRESHLPGWLWFFLALPMGLIVALLYKRNRLPLVRRSLPPARRYTEPDSIPLDMSDVHPAAVGFQPEPAETPAEAEVGVDAEDAAMAKAAAEESKEPVGTGKPDDLKVIEGIGPAISGILRDHGIATFRALAGTPVDRLNEILTEARLNRLADPATWPEQARLAAEGKWDALEELQGRLKAGRRVNND
jgi:predicted flap endonuclease-1-like 5' DNA nuclease